MECNKKLQTVIHLSEPEDIDAKALFDTLEAINIAQHIKLPTHNIGHTIDIIATEIRQNRNVSTILGPYISDQWLIAVQLEEKKPQNRINEIEYRRITETAIQEFKNKFNDQPILDTETLKKAVYQLDNQLKNALKDVAPLITKEKPKHNKKPWYDKQLNDQWKIIKNKETKWLKYKHKTSGTHTRGRETDTLQCLN